MALEIGTMGPRLHAAVDRVVAEGRLAQLLDALEGVVADTAVAATVRARIATAAAVQQIVTREPIDFKLLERLVPLVGAAAAPPLLDALDRKSTRLNSSHGYISYAVFCLKKKNKKRHTNT